MVLFVGDTAEYLSSVAMLYDQNAILVTDKNYNSIEITQRNTFFTSLGDLNKYNFTELLDITDEVLYCPPAKWTDHKLKKTTEEFLLISKTRNNNVIGLSNPNTDNIFSLVPKKSNRKNNLAQIWTIGDSNTYAIGVSKEESYSYKLAKLIGLEYTNLSISASSHTLQSSVLLQSDLKRGDIIFWGLSSPEKETLAITNDIKISKKLRHITPASYLIDRDINSLLPLNLLDSEQYIFNTVIAILNVYEVCLKIGVTLILGGLKVEEKHCKYLSTFDNYIHLYSSATGHKDYATDNDHPGPKTHTWFAEQFYKKYLDII